MDARVILRQQDGAMLAVANPEDEQITLYLGRNLDVTLTILEASEIMSGLQEAFRKIRVYATTH